MIIKIIKGLAILGGLLILWVVDIRINREVAFREYSVKYPFYLFNKSFGYLYTHGHSYTNDEYKANAHNQLNRKLCTAYQASKAQEIKHKLESEIASDTEYKSKYQELVIEGTIQADSICAYQEELFADIALK